jgi:hypothetical protein
MREFRVLQEMAASVAASGATSCVTTNIEVAHVQGRVLERRTACCGFSLEGMQPPFGIPSEKKNKKITT